MQVTHPMDEEEVRLCLWCRRKGAEETMAAKERSIGEDPPTADAS